VCCRSISDEPLPGPSSSSVLFTRGRGAVPERPDPVFELQREEAVVLTGRFQRPSAGIEAQLRAAPIRISRLCTRFEKRIRVEVLRTVARRRHARRVEVGDLPGAPWIAYIEHAQAGVEVSAGQRGGVTLVVHAAVVTSVGKSR